MKKSIAIVLCLVLVIAAATMVLAACDSASVTVTYMDGDQVLKIDKVEVGQTFELYTPPAKADAKFVNWYTDKDLTTLYVEDKLMAQLTLYAKYVANEYSVVIDANEGTIDADKRLVKVTPNAEYTMPIPTREGYTFVGYTYQDNAGEVHEFAATGTYTFSESIKVKANWEEAKYTVTFMDGNNEIVKNVVSYKTTVYAPSATKDGYTFAGWLDADNKVVTDTSFEVTKDVTYTVKWTPKTFNITVENLASANCTVEYMGNYDLPASPTLPEWAKSFTGYTMDKSEFAASGVYTWTKSITVTANFERDEMYNKSHVTIYTADTTTPAQELYVEDGATIAAELAGLTTTKAGYSWKGWRTSEGAFAVNTVITDNITIYADYEPKTVLIIINKYNGSETLTATYGEAFALPTPAARNGYKFLGYLRNGVAFNGTLAIGDYDELNITITDSWEQIASPDEGDANKLFVKGDNYYKERESLTDEFTYVFLTGYNYNLNGIKSIVGAGTYMDVTPTNTGVKLAIKNSTASFNMQVTRDVDGTDYTYWRKVKIVNNVSMDYGTDYTNIWGTQAQSGTQNFQVARSESDVMAAGIQDFRFDLAISTIEGESTKTLSFNKANIDVTVTKGGEDVDSSLYTVDYNKGAIDFNDELCNQTVSVTVAPRYAAEVNAKTFTLALNDGVNVYTSAELKSAYGNLDVHSINILRNITAELAASDYIADHGKKTDNVSLYKYENGVKEDTPTAVLENIDIGAPKNDYYNGVYTRLTDDDTDTMQINGNFFAIDGSKLPYIDNRYDKYGSGGSQFTSGDSYRISQVQIGIFLYRNFVADKDGSTLARYAGGTLDIDNLLVSGNAIPEYNGLAQDLGDGGMPLLKMSGAYNGILCRGGTVNLDNVTVTKTSIGIFTDGGVDGYYTYYDNESASTKSTYTSLSPAVVINMNKCRVTDNWANDIYAYYITKITLTETKLGPTAGGAAIAFDDKPFDKTVSDVSTELVIDDWSATNIENWVSGGEAWFTAYGIGSLAIATKTEVDSATQYYLGGMRVLDSTEKMMNFAIFARPGGSYENSEWAADAQGVTALKVNGTTYYSTPLAPVMYAANPYIPMLALTGKTISVKPIWGDIILLLPVYAQKPVLAE